MGRQPDPDSKTVLVATKVSTTTAAALDTSRGALERAAWLREAIETALSEEADVVPITTRTALDRISRCTDEELAAAIAALPESSRKRLRSLLTEPGTARKPPGKDENCDHPPGRRDPKNKNLCRACGNVILPAGKPDSAPPEAGTGRKITSTRPVRPPAAESASKTPGKRVPAGKRGAWTAKAGDKRPAGGPA